MRLPSVFWATLFCALFAQVAPLLPAHAGEPNPAIGDALRSLFNPGSAPDANTMGLLQRVNFIDRVAGKNARLEIVFVIDATESMQDQLQGIQQRLQDMLADIRRVAGDEVYVQIVLYRDSGAPSGVISWPLGKQGFLREPQAIQDGLVGLVAESGAPYFHEAVDQGIYAALNDVPWSTAAQVKRWIVLMGDAPPLDRGFHEPENGAERKYSTEQLVQRAQQSGIEINAIVCPTRVQDAAIYQEVVGLTRYFFGELTSQTGGWMLDLSDPKLLESVATASRSAVSDFIQIAPITRAELAELRAQANTQQTPLAPGQRIRVAVMPHLKLEEMNFSRRDPAVRFADEMRSQLETVGLDVEVVSNFELERTFYKIKTQAMSREAALQQVGLGVAADYVFWGVLMAGSPGKVDSGILDTKSGKFIVSIPGGVEAQFPVRATLCSTVLDALAQASKQSGNPLQLARVQRRFQTRLVASSEEVERLTLSARGRIADVMQMELDHAQSQPLWAEAQADLEAAFKLAPDNPLVNSLLANVYFGQFQILQAKGDRAAADKRRQANQFAGEAKKQAGLVLESDRLEIEADFNFYRNNFNEAAGLYEQIVQRADTLAHVERARWMLAGIYAGDWGIDKLQSDLVDAGKARQQIVQLLAFFEDSPHARLLARYLLWDESSGSTLSPNLPRTHVELVAE